MMRYDKNTEDIIIVILDVTLTAIKGSKKLRALLRKKIEKPK